MADQRKPDPICDPAALRKPDAAAHCGVSAGYFTKLVSEGVMPEPRLLGPGVKVWLRAEIEEALLAAPSEHGTDDANPCDRLLEA